MPDDASTSPLRFEERIVWLRPVDELPRYVRESEVDATTRQRPPSRNVWPAGFVGYAVLERTAPSTSSPFARRYRRRVFWLAGHDPYKDGGAPGEAVDPLTIAPGKRGERTARVTGGKERPR